MNPGLAHCRRILYQLSHHGGPQEQIEMKKTDHHSVTKRNEFGSVLVSWMDLELVIQIDVSQKEKNEYHILTHIYGI